MVCNDELRVEFRWDTQVLVVVRDEGDLAGVLSDPGFDFPHPFYTVEGSPLVRLFVEDSAGVRQATEIVHFALYTVDECVDLLATSGPLSVLTRS